MPSKGPGEREHIIRWSDDPEEPLNVYTHRQAAAKRLLAQGGTLKRTGKIEGREVSWTIECPREWFRWPRPKAGSRVRQGKALAARHQDAPSMSVDAARAPADGGNPAGTDSDPSEGR